MFTRAGLKSESYSKARRMHLQVFFGLVKRPCANVVHRIGSRLLFVCSIGTAILIGAKHPRPSLDNCLGVTNRHNNG